MFSFLGISVLPITKAVGVDDGEGVADGASDQGAKGSAEQARRRTAACGVVLGACGSEGRAGAEADQCAHWRERGWTRCKC